MDMDSLNTQLLKAMGVGVALIALDDLTLRFQNPCFAEWFGEGEVGAPADGIFEGVDLTDLREKVEENGAASVEIRMKRRRRMLVIEATFRLAAHNGDAIMVVECQNISRLRETESMIDSYSAMVERKARDLEREKTQVEKLLLNVMPRSVYEEYKTFGSVTPQLYEPVSVLMLDFVGFTEMAAKADPTVTVGELNDMFTAFDRIAELHGCERIKTIGDAYLAVAGLPHPNPDHVDAVAKCATTMIRYLERRNRSHARTWRARIGLASGSVVGSVVGVQKYVYDVFGPAVNMASRLQNLSAPMEITVHADMISGLSDAFAVAQERDEVLRGLGSVPVASLTARDDPALAA